MNYWLNLEETSAATSTSVARSQYLYDRAVEMWSVSHDDVGLFMDLLIWYLKLDRGEAIKQMPTFWPQIPTVDQFFKLVKISLERDDLFLCLYKDKSIRRISREDVICLMTT